MGKIISTFVSRSTEKHAGAPTLDVVILNGSVIDPETNLDDVRNVGIRDGRIVSITREKLPAKRVIDAKPNALLVAWSL